MIVGFDEARDCVAEASVCRSTARRDGDGAVTVEVIESIVTLADAVAVSAKLIASESVPVPAWVKVRALFVPNTPAVASRVSVTVTALARFSNVARPAVLAVVMETPEMVEPVAAKRPAHRYLSSRRSPTRRGPGSC